MITKFQNGGQAKQRNQQQSKQSNQQQVIQAIIQSIEQAPEQTVDTLIQKGMNPQQLMQIIQQLYQGQAISPENAERASARLQQYAQSASKGAKLQYISSLKNKCKEDEELVYMKAGGTFCKKCEKRIKVQAEKGGGAVKEFKAKYDKCGGKVKKKEMGGQMPQQKKPQKSTPKKTSLPTKFDPTKAKDLRDRFKKNGYKPLPKTSMDSLQWYNRHDPNEQGV